MTDLKTYADVFPHWADRFDSLPVHMRGGVERYVLHGISPGGFLTAVFENDLKGATWRADETNRYLLFEWGRFLTNGTPSDCQGSRKAVADWIARGGVMGIRKFEAKIELEVTE